MAPIKRNLTYIQQIAISFMTLMAASALALPQYYEKVHHRPSALEKMEDEDAQYHDAIDSGDVEIVTDESLLAPFNPLQPYYRRTHLNSGVYIGAGAGMEAGDIRFSTESYSTSIGTEGPLARLFAGYQWFFKDKGGFVSAELAADYTAAKNDDVYREETDAQWRQKNRRLYAGEVALLFGHRLPSEDAMWLRLGGSAIQLHHDAFLSGADYVVEDFDKWMLGYAVELGFEAYLTDQWFLRLSHGYRYYPQHTFELVDYEQSGLSGFIGFTPSDYQARFSLGYHFTPHRGYKYFASTVPVSGIYVGLHAGSDRLVAKASHTHQLNDKYEFTTSNASWAGGVFGGYFHALGEKKGGFFGSLGVGIEGLVQFSTKGVDYQYLNTLRTLESWNISGLLSYRLVNNNQIYLKAGAGYAMVRAPWAPLGTENPKLTQGVEWTKSLPAFTAALGYETLVTKHIAIRSEVETSILDHFDLLEGEYEDAYMTRVYAYRLGMSYRFGGGK